MLQLGSGSNAEARSHDRLRSTGRLGAAVPTWFVVGTGLVEIDFLESKALQQAGDRLTGVLLGSSEDAIG